MAQQQMPDPVRLYRGAAANTQRVFDGVKESQLTDATPCNEWDVRALMAHMTDGQSRGASMMSGTDVSPSGATPAERFASASAALAEAAGRPGVLEQEFETPFGRMPGAAWLMGSFMDVLVHGWDLAKATGQEPRLPEDLAETCLSIFGPQLAGFRETGNFGPEVAVAADASVQDRLVGAFGRRP